jgi:hypothetical protein
MLYIYTIQLYGINIRQIWWNTMAERHGILHDRAIANLLRQNDRVSKISDGYGEFCFAPKLFDVSIAHGG